MKPPQRTQSRFGRFGRFGRSRFRYDHHWWGEPEAPSAASDSYWASTRRPLPCLLFVLPLLLTYEVGLGWVAGRSADDLRAGADSWLRDALAAGGLTDRLFPPLALVCVLLAWQALDRGEWRFRPLILVGMAVESLVLAVGLVGMSRLVDLGFDRLDGPFAPASAIPAAGSLAPLLGFLGAGIYEEALFRLAAVPVLYKVGRLLAAPGVAASTLAITGSSLLFSLAHHAGAPGEPFTLFVFVFRWLAGVFFAYIFVARGFGVAVGTHSAYDLLVGWCDVSF